MRLLVLIGILGMGGSGLAAPFTREQPPPPPLTHPEPIQAAPAPAAPPIDFVAVVGLDELRAPPRLEQEQILIELIAQTPDSSADEKADYYFRLGMLYSAQQLFWLEKARGLSGRDAAKAAEMTKVYLLKTVKTFRDLTDNDAFRDYPRLDRALFAYGFTLQSGRYLKEARAVYDKLLKSFPDSAFAPAAHLAFGDYYLEQNQLADAEARYKVALKFPRSPAYAYALYRMGGVQLATQRWQEALETYFQVVQLASLNQKLEQLHHAAELGFVDAYARIGKLDKAAAAFDRVDKAHAAELAGLLAQRACDAKAEALRAMPATADTAKELDVLVAIARAPGAEPSCKANAAAVASALTRAWHNEYATNHAPDALARAEHAYALYLAAFPDATDHAEMHAGYAEVLWSHAAQDRGADRWMAAASELLAVAATDPTRTGDELPAGVLAWKNALGTPPADRADLAAASRDHTRPRPIPAREQQALAVIASQAGSLADADAVVELQLFAAERYRRYGHPDLAIALLADIVDRYPTHPKAELAANLVLDSMLRAHKLDDALVYAVDLLSAPELMAGKLGLARNIALVQRLVERR